MMSLYDAIASRLEHPVRGEDPVEWVRATLRSYRTWLAVLNGDDPESWDVYVERHVAGWRFAIYDAWGGEVDLTQVAYREGKKK